MSELADRVLVLGLARSGRAAVEALNARGADVVAHDSNDDLDAGESLPTCTSASGATPSSTASAWW